MPCVCGTNCAAGVCGTNCAAGACGTRGAATAPTCSTIGGLGLNGPRAAESIGLRTASAVLRTPAEPGLAIGLRTASAIAGGAPGGVNGCRCVSRGKICGVPGAQFAVG